MGEPSHCISGADRIFGPRISGCRDGFDFTLVFEQSILSMLPTCLFIIAAVPRIVRLYRSNLVLKKGAHSDVILKLGAILAYAASQLALIVVSARDGYTGVSIASYSLSLLSGIIMGALSYLEHYRSIRPSLILGTFLIFSILFDVAQARTLWLQFSATPCTIIFTTGLALKAAITLFESGSKKNSLQAPYQAFSPESLVGIYNRSVFWWLNSLLWRGSHNVLRPEDLFPLDTELSSQACKGLRNRLAHRKPSKHALFWATMREYWRPILLVMFPRFCLAAFTIAQPLLFNKVILAISENDDPQKQDVGRALIGATALIYLGLAFSTAFYKHYIYRTVTMIRSGLIDLIYLRTLKLDPKAAQDSAALTHISTDIDRIVAGLENSDILWAAPFEVIAAIYILQTQIGLATVAPVAIAIGCTLAAFGLGKLSVKAQVSWVAAVQTRVSEISSMLNHFKEIRMSGLSGKFATEVQAYRDKELDISLGFRRISAVKNVIGILPSALGSVGGFLIFALALPSNDDSRLDPATAFTSLSLISLLSMPIFLFVFALPQFTASLGCFKRIQEFVLQDSLEADKLPDSTTPEVKQSKQDSKDFMQLVELKSPAMNVPEKALVEIRNASFCFKGEEKLVLRNVSLQIIAPSFYMLAGTVGSGKSALLQAILGEMEMADGILQKAWNIQIGYCAQEPWLPNLSIRQVILNGSGPDEELYTAAVKACALEEDFASLEHGEETVIGSSGNSLSGGQKQRLSLARALYSRKQLLLLDDVTSGLDRRTEKIVMQRVLGRNGFCRNYGLSVVLATHSRRFMNLMDHIIKFDTGEIVQMGPPSLVEITDDDEELASANESSKPIEQANPPGLAENDGRADLARRIGDLSLYAYYFKSMGWPLSTVIISFATFFTFCYKFPDYWLGVWANAEISGSGANNTMYAAVYAIFGLLIVFFMFATVWALIVVAIPRSASRLHKTLLTTVISAPYSFFVKVDTGVILNHFSQDMSLVDMQLPYAFLQTVDGVLEVIATAVLIALSSKWLVISYPPILLMLYFLQKFYLRTSRQMRFLDLEAKAPLYTHLTETLQGLITIRAFNWQSASINRNRELVDESQKPFYLMYSIQRWLRLMLDLIVTIIAVTVVAIATQVESRSNASALGVALANIVSFSQTLAYLIQAWTQLETSMGAISRVKSLEQTTQSENLVGETGDAGENWPQAGEIEFLGVTATHDEAKGPVLMDVSLQIPAGSKVGICGRSGSGKSSLIQTLLRLTAIQGGTIKIDDIDISQLPREDIRRRITTLSQTPLIFPDSVRNNLDPYSTCSDEAILTALNAVGLGAIVQERGGLDSESDIAKNFSAGQLQLFCMARALLEHSQIVLLDEATSNIDIDTELFITKLVEEKFAKRTVVAVAHRLQTIRDFDLIVVMDRGRVVEVGAPRALLRDEKSHFFKLWTAQEHR